MVRAGGAHRHACRGRAQDQRGGKRLSEKGRQQLRTLDLQAAGGTADDARNFVKSEVAKWAPVIKAAKISM